MAFDLPSDYKQVPERIADFKAKHPEGSLRPLNPDRPFEIVDVAGQTFIVYVAAAYRTPDDPAPGVGSAWELVPGKTPYTKLSELQNAETSAWGRAIVAVLASESKAVASAEDVRNRQADHATPDQPKPKPVVLDGFLDADDQKTQHDDLADTIKASSPEVREHMKAWRSEQRLDWPMKRDDLERMWSELAAAQKPADDSRPFDEPSPEASELVAKANRIRAEKARAS